MRYTAWIQDVGGMRHVGEFETVGECVRAAQGLLSDCEPHTLTSTDHVSGWTSDMTIFRRKEVV